MGVSIKKQCNGFYEFTQHALINSIIEDVGISNSKTKPVPAKVSLQLHAFKNEQVFDLDFNYRSVVGKLNYLAQTTHPDIMYAMHQIAKYSSDPRQLHGKAILYLIHYLKKTLIWTYVSSLIPPKDLSATVMQTSQDCGTRHLHRWTPVLQSHEVVGSSSMQDALALGPPNFNPKLQCPLLTLSILQCHKLYVTSFLSWHYYRKWGSKISRFFVLSPTYMAKSLRTTQVPLNWQGFPSFALEPSTSTYATIILFGRGLSKYSPLTPRIRLLTLLPSPWLKMIFNVIVASCATSDPHKLPKWGSVTLLVLWYLFYR